MEKILYEVKKIVVGQDNFLERVMVAILAHGHLLVEGVPGLAKTLTVKTLAATVRGSFRRIQLTLNSFRLSTFSTDRIRAQLLNTYLEISDALRGLGVRFESFKPLNGFRFRKSFCSASGNIFC